MTNEEYEQGVAEGLQAWIKDTKSEDKIAKIKSIQKDLEACRRLLQRFQEELNDAIKDLPSGMAGALGCAEHDKVSIMPQIYFWAKKYGVSLEVAREQLVTSMMGKTDRTDRKRCLFCGLLWHPPDECKV